MSLMAASVPDTRVDISEHFFLGSALGEEGEPPALEGKERRLQTWAKGNDAASTPRRGGAGDKREKARAHPKWTSVGCPSLAAGQQEERPWARRRNERG